MKKLFLLSQVAFCLIIKGQNSLDIVDLGNYINVYDSNALRALPPINLMVTTWMNGPDTNFAGIVDPTQKFKKLFDYPYASIDPRDNYFLWKVNNSKDWFTMMLNPVFPSLQQNWVESLMLLDSTLHFKDTVTMFYPYQYTYKGRVFNTQIELDVHDQKAVKLNGKTYFLSIGTHLEWYDASGSWLNDDSVLVKFTTFHIIDVATNSEMARWNAQKAGFTLENFGNPAHVDILNGGVKYYSHPHLNVIESIVNGGGVDIYASFRQPGNIGKLKWSGVSSDSIHLEWLFGYPPRHATSFYLKTNTTNQLDANHGADPFFSGDTTFMLTYNNNADIDTIGGMHQVWMVLHDTATLIWSTPDIGIETSCKGYAKWTPDGKYILTAHGYCGGERLTPDGMGGYTSTSDYEKLQIWDPWNNKKIAAVQLPGTTMIYALDFIERDRIIDFSPIDVLISDSISFSHSHSGLKYWTIGFAKYSSSQLKLPLNYLDSLNEISAWIQTGDFGYWRCDKKAIFNGIAMNANQANLNIATIQTIGNYSLPKEYKWKAYDIYGQEISPKNIHSAGIYILEGKCLNSETVYRKKHVFVN